MSNDAVILCSKMSPIAKGETLPLSGTIIGQCSKCNLSVWVSPSSQLLLKQFSTIKILCGDCGEIEIEKSENARLAMTPEQMADAEALARGVNRN